MSLRNFILVCFTTGILLSCKEGKDEIVLDPETEILVQQINQLLHPLGSDPLMWEDSDLTFLDQVAESSVVGLGEATHGTSEFFSAKHRIFRYLVENHNFKVFAIEADFGESLFINDAVQRGAINEIRDLMVSKMHFWTWATTEVKMLIEWMCQYNMDKPDSEKVQYVGIDCQFNTFHPGLLREYLDATEASFLDDVNEILEEAEIETNKNFESYSVQEFEHYLGRLDAIEDSMQLSKDEIIVHSSEEEFELNLRVLRLIRQSSRVRKYGEYSIHYRDQFMAENTIWWKDYFGEKVVLWAHNGHVADDPNYFTVGGSMGHHLTNELSNDYEILGFLFSRGSFNAMGSAGLRRHTIDEAPSESSINFVMSNTGNPALAVKIGDLQNNKEWGNTLIQGLSYFQLGAVYNGNRASYYSKFIPDHYDYIIYFDKTTESGLF